MTTPPDRMRGPQDARGTTPSPAAPRASGDVTGPVPTDPAGAAPRDLRTSAVDGVKWNLIATVVSLVTRLLFTFALARLVGPTDFGIVSMGMLYVMFAVIVLDQGFGTALIQRKQLGPHDVGSVVWLNVTMGTVLTLLTLVLAPVAADFFDTPELTGVLRALSVTLFIRGFTLVPQALVQRSLRFREWAMITTAGVLAGGIAGVTVAALGGGYWSMVVQALVNDVLVVTWLMILFPPTRWRASWRSLRSMMGFSSKMLVSNFMNYIEQNADNILIGRVLNATELALYALAYRLLRMPVQMVASVVNQVSMPIFSQMQDDDARTRAWFRVATQCVCLVTFPVFALLLVAAEPGVGVLFGAEWSGTVPPLQAMALAGFPMIARMLLGSLANSRGRAGLTMGWSITVVSLQFLGFFVGIHVGGMVGVAVSIAVVQYATFIPNVWHVIHRSVGMRMRDYLGALVAPILGSAVAGGAWYATYLPFRPAPGQGHDVLPVLGATLVALALYVVVIRVVWPATFRTAREIGTQMARRKPAAI
jgi:O-antigen/teichoic acid export membrane protein